MVFIIRALSHVRKRMMETMVPPQVGMRLRTKNKKTQKRGQISPNEKKEKMREKERRDNVTILFPHLCFKVAP